MRPYQDHLGGLDRAFKTFKMLLKGLLSGLESLLKTTKTTLSRGQV